MNSLTTFQEHNFRCLQKDFTKFNLNSRLLAKVKGLLFVLPKLEVSTPLKYLLTLSNVKSGEELSTKNMMFERF